MTGGSAGDFAAFFAGQFEQRVNGVVKRFNVGRQDAEDVVQEAMLDLMPKWGTDRARNPEALLTTIIQRRVYRFWGRSAPAAVGPLDDEVYWLEASAADPAVTAEQRDTIRRAADVLSPVERRIVLGRALQDPAAAVAVEVGVSAEAVRSAGRRMQQRMMAAAESQDAVPGLGPIDVAEYIKDLPHQQGRVLTLALEGFWPSTIGQILGITSNDARVNLHHAKKAVIGMLPASADAERRIPFMIKWARRRADSAFSPRSASSQPRGVPSQFRRPA